MLIVDSHLLFTEPASTQIFFIEEYQKTLLTFTGFLKTPQQEITGFDCRQVIVYTGSQVQKIITNYMKIIKVNQNTQGHSLREFSITREIERKVFEWLFHAEQYRELG